MQDYILNLKWDHRKSLSTPSFSQLLETFPEAKKLLAQNLRNEIERAHTDLEQARKLEAEFENIIYCKSPKEDEWFWRAVCNALYINPLREGREQLIERNTFRLKALYNKDTTGAITTLDIEHAKLYPIDTLVTFTMGKAKCLWHNEKSGSMHYYKKSNRIKCFGCDKSGDVIDVYMQLFGVTFLEAVKKIK